MTTHDVSPAQLAYCIALARDTYEAHAKFYQLDIEDRPFGVLPYTEKQQWIERALDVIEGVGAPSKVIARITPSEPYGIARADWRTA